MKIIGLFLFVLFGATVACADSVILMIGDGMGANHIACAAKNNDLFLKTLTPNTFIKTASADNTVTDSAASATAYACGLKTKNGFVGMDKYKKNCQTIAEEAAKWNKKVYLISSDKPEGATPSAFYAHVPGRYQKDKILSAYQQAQKRFYMDFDSPSVSASVNKILPELQSSQKDFFVMVEGAKIDKESHNKNFNRMVAELVDFDKAVAAVWAFAEKRRDVHVFVTADHETGGLDDNCRYGANNHTAANVPFYAKTTLTVSKQPIHNTEVHKLARRALFK